MMKFFVVDDHRSGRQMLTDMLSAVEGSSAVEADSVASARAVMRSHTFDLAFVDVHLSKDKSKPDGIEVLKELRESATPVVMVTGFGDIHEIQAAIRAGASDYVLKDDLCEEVVLKIVEDVRQQRNLEREVLGSRARNAEGAAPAGQLGLVGASLVMDQLRKVIRRAAVADRPALVLGPSGSGKELVARALHVLGPNPEADLLDINCSAMPATLMETLLFGHEKGAFTGAMKGNSGYFSAVKNGTLFLDEIAELPLELQAKLLRVLESGTFRPIGSFEEIRFKGRIVAATHADLADRVRQGKFREDLFHRLDVLRIRVPSLEERRDDVPALVNHFAARLKRPLRFSEDAVRALQLAPWPGNVRQLRNLIDRLSVFCDDDPISASSLERLENISAPPTEDVLRQAARLVLSSGVDNKLEAIERAIIDEAMRLADGNKSQAARLIGVGRKAVERRTNPGRGPDEDD
jgi:DNA-binding NtrC family response regulator